MAIRVLVENITVATAKLGNHISQRLVQRRGSRGSSPVGVGKVGGALEHRNYNDDEDHHWKKKDVNIRDTTNQTGVYEQIQLQTGIKTCPEGW